MVNENIISKLIEGFFSFRDNWAIIELIIEYEHSFINIRIFAVPVVTTKTVRKCTSNYQRGCLFVKFN